MDRLEQASAAELASCSLLRRQETKFLLSADRLAGLVDDIAGHYRVAFAGTERIARYRTLYFDTPELQCFRDQNARLPHHKVRIRHYDDRCLSVVEVKSKGTDMQTQKLRLSKEYGDSTLGERERAFVAPHVSFSVGSLAPQLWTNFSRVTLVGSVGERITLDSDFEFRRGELRLHFSEVVVVEVKQASYSESTAVMRALGRMGLHPMSVSKYGAAIALTNAQNARHRFASGTSAPL